jgi:hypothetical protein
MCECGPPLLFLTGEWAYVVNANGGVRWRECEIVTLACGHFAALSVPGRTVPVANGHPAHTPSAERQCASRTSVTLFSIDRSTDFESVRPLEVVNPTLWV